MTVETRRTAGEIINLDYDTRRSLGSYALTKAAAEEAARVLADADAAIERINRGLPEGHMVATQTSSNIVERAPGSGGYRAVYRPKGDSFLYEPYGSLCTDGDAMTFLGDRIAIIDGMLIVINDEHRIGLEASSEVYVVDTENDSWQRTTGGSHLERFAETIEIVSQVQPEQQLLVDRSYY